MHTCRKIAVLCCTLFHYVFSVPTTTLPPGCVRDGKHYAVQQSFQPSPCEHCTCSLSGEVFCAIADCFITPCVDAVHDPTKCCPVCPNGPNCLIHGQIVPAGQTVQVDNSMCSCPDNLHLHFGIGAGLPACTQIVNQVS
ncbi:hypothetical protein CHS0354_017776 [Potamilus streckersoni]|uniref:VWFC domain-containing protein n=1 Tax=Potamilus streckersoni TaxID=2493646 RepID=A0AAE0T8T4_9BIVA|nr:hypothetical protein CHS0354_017776 [Potamilus streckersoni]